MHQSWIKGSLALAVTILVTGVAVPVTVSASETTKAQRTATTKVATTKLQKFNQQVQKLSPQSIKAKVAQTSDAQLHSQASKNTDQLKQTVTDPKIAQGIQSVSLADLKQAATDASIGHAKQAWNSQATAKLQEQLNNVKAGNQLTAAQAQKLQHVNVADAIQALTPSRFRELLSQLTDSQWASIKQSLITDINQGAENLATPTTQQVRQASQQVTSQQVANLQEKTAQATKEAANQEYFTDVLNNQSQMTTGVYLGQSLISFLLPILSVMNKFFVAPVAGALFGAAYYGGIALFFTLLESFEVTTIFAIVWAFWLTLNAIPIVGPLSMFIPMLLIGGANIIAGFIEIFVYPLVVLYLGVEGAYQYGVLAFEAAPLVPPTFELKQTKIPRFDQVITYADAQKAGHQYTQAINVIAGHAYRVDFKADQASNQEANDPVTNFGTLTYGLVADKTGAIGKSDASGLVTDVKNGSATITSREHTNNEITFTATKTGTIYLVADTAEASVNSRITQDDYASIPLWYVNSSIATTLR